MFKDESLADEVKLFRVYKRCTLGASALFRMAFALFKPLMKRNLLSGRPSLFIFDSYRLGYLCLVNRLDMLEASHERYPHHTGLSGVGLSGALPDVSDEPGCGGHQCLLIDDSSDDDSIHRLKPC